MLATLTTAWGATGYFVSTGIQANIAISGPGYFALRDPVTGIVFATRFGEFSIDANGYWVSPSGLRLEGYSDTNLTQMGDLQLGEDYFDTSAVASYEVEPDGKIFENLVDGTHVLNGQILLQQFAAPEKLSPYPGGLREVTAAAGPLPQPLAPGSAGFGTILTGQLELPNPSLALVPNQPPAPGFSQGILTSTGIESDFAIEGRGYFLLRDTNSSTLYASRAGACYLDGNGYLVNYSGLRLQGYSDPALSMVGDIAVNSDDLDGMDPGQFMMGWEIDSSGNITVVLTDGSSYAVGQVLLTDCAHPEFLTRTNFSLSPLTSAAGPWATPAPPATAGLGLLISGAVELNQLDQSILNVRSHLNFFVQGAIFETTNATDFALNGSGFFTVRDPVRNVFYATRDGAFHLDSGAWLVDTNGFRVQGFADAALSTHGDIRIDATGAPTSADPKATLRQWTADSSGNIDVELSDGTIFTRGEILLQNYRALQSLVLVTNLPVNSPGFDLIYSNVAAALPQATIGGPGTEGMGSLMSSALEIPYVAVPLELPPTNGLCLKISGLATTATLETSLDLLHWTDTAQVSGSLMQDAEWFETNSTISAPKYFRLRIGE